MISMTGYGKGEYKEGGIELTCEIKTVNNRYLDIAVKSPRIFTAYDEVIRSIVREKLTRGHADIFVSLKDKREKPQNLVPDLSLAAAYVQAAQKIKANFPELEFDVTVSSVLRYPEVLKADEGEAAADEELLTALKTALTTLLRSAPVITSTFPASISEARRAPPSSPIGGRIARWSSASIGMRARSFPWRLPRA